VTERPLRLAAAAASSASAEAAAEAAVSRSVDESTATSVSVAIADDATGGSGGVVAPSMPRGAGTAAAPLAPADTGSVIGVPFGSTPPCATPLTLLCALPFDLAFVLALGPFECALEVFPFKPTPSLVLGESALASVADSSDGGGSVLSWPGGPPSCCAAPTRNRPRRLCVGRTAAAAAAASPFAGHVGIGAAPDERAAPRVRVWHFGCNIR
jgi:hypothetical protein